MKIAERTKLLIAILGLAAITLAGACYAYWSTSMSHLNELKADSVQASINETFRQDSVPEGTVTKKVSFKNEGSAAAFLRIAEVEAWRMEKDGSQMLLSNTVDGRPVATKNWTDAFRDSSLWEKGDDGWYYYKKILAPGKTTEDILASVTFPEYEGAYQDYAKADYMLYFRMELLQASDSRATLNKSEVNAKAGQTVFGRKAVVDGSGTVSWE